MYSSILNRNLFFPCCTNLEMYIQQTISMHWSMKASSDECRSDRTVLASLAIYDKKIYAQNEQIILLLFNAARTENM
jgi:hypothetical protein